MLYSDYRPQCFNEVIGQDNNILTLKEQIKKNKYDSAYLFAGHRGTGKTTIARILARAINCENVTENGPCNQCKSCKSMLDNATLDFIELDAASHNSIQDIKELIASTKYLPTLLKYKIYIVDEVHNLSNAAFDALLKTIEEPPEHCCFILCTTELHKIPATIRSRCSIYQFRAISIEYIHDRLAYILKELEKPYEDDAINLIAKQSDGSMRDALSIMEKQMITCDKLTISHVKKSLSLMDDDISLDMLDAMFEQKGDILLSILNTVYQEGKHLGYLIDYMIETLTDGLLLLTTEGNNHIYNSTTYKDRLTKLITKTNMSLLFWYIEQLGILKESIRHSFNPYMDIQLAFIKCCNPRLMNDQIPNLLMRVTRLENELQNIQLTTTKDIHEENTDNSKMETPEEEIQQISENNHKPKESAGETDSLCTDEKIMIESNNTTMNEDNLSVDEDETILDFFGDYL